jgi:hypothetical protein
VTIWTEHGLRCNFDAWVHACHSLLFTGSYKQRAVLHGSASQVFADIAVAL